MLLAPKELRPVPTRCFMNVTSVSDEKVIGRVMNIEGVGDGHGSLRKFNQIMLDFLKNNS